MSRAFVLNSASFQNVAPDELVARTRICDLVTAIAKLVDAYGAEPILRSETFLDEIMLTADYGVSHWRVDPRVDLDLRKFLLHIVGKAPLLPDLPLDKPNVRDQFLSSIFFTEGLTETEIPSAGIALLLGDILASVFSEERWGQPELAIIQRCLNPENGDIDIETKATIPHISTPAHSEPVGRWLQKILRSEITNPEKLWADRSVLFPNIDFCVAVAEQLRQVQMGVFSMVVERLADLDESARCWREQQTPQPQYGFWTHPESLATLQRYGYQRKFKLANGTIFQFSLHIRYPGEGRIYFHPDGTQYRIIVGYIGPHLNTMRFD